MTEWIDNMPIPPWAKNFAGVVVVAVIATTFMLGHANEVKGMAKEAKNESIATKQAVQQIAEAVKTNAAKEESRGAQTTDKLHEHDRRITLSEKAVLEIAKAISENKAERAKIASALNDVKANVAAVEARQEVQTKAILDAIRRIEQKVDRVE